MGEAHAFADAILAVIIDRPPDFADKFEVDDGNWELSHGKGAFGYHDGEFFLTAEPGECLTVQPSSHPVFADFVLEVEVRFARDGRADTQIDFRDQQSVGGYFLSSRPFITVNVAHNNVPEGSTPEIEGADVLRTKKELSRETNRLQVIASGPQILVLVDNQVAFYAVDPEYEMYPASGEVQLSTCNSGQISSEVYYDNFRIWDISEFP